MSETTAGSVLVVIENVGTCNLRCGYCFPEHLWEREGHAGVMPYHRVRRSVERALEATAATAIQVRFAGGEPLLAGQAWLEEAMRVSTEVADDRGAAVSFSLQTNATQVTAELAAFLAANDVHVGVSLDGPPELNERTRGHTAGTLRGLFLLTTAYGRPPGVIVTVTRCNAHRMAEVVDYLDELGVAMFRANLMGATSSWSEHLAPRAEDWLSARRTLVRELAARRGRIMEFNLLQLVGKLDDVLADGADPFASQYGCHGMRCPAGRELVYVDQRGDVFPCPRANVAAGGQVANVSDELFAERWGTENAALDAAMTTPDACRRCPAQLVCDYGCHAFNVAGGNFFAVNCDATKAWYQGLEEELEDLAQLVLLARWRAGLRAGGLGHAARRGVEVPEASVLDALRWLRDGLAVHRASGGRVTNELTQRRGWQSAAVPVRFVTRSRVG